MFAGFNLKIENSFFDSQKKSLQEYKKIGEEHLRRQRDKVENSLYTYITDIDKNIIDGTKMQNDWFPGVEADVFLSHSSLDRELVNAIAGWLHDTFGLKCFVDSNVWDYAGNMAEMLNAHYSDKRKCGSEELYNHKKCLKVSEHVNCMLSIALQKMIDKCESVFLINTERSIHVVDYKSKKIEETYSPWIYLELVCSEIIRRRPLKDYRTGIRHSFELASKELIISYNVNTNHLQNIDQDILKSWSEQYDGNLVFPLDLLYADVIEDIEKVEK